MKKLIAVLAVFVLTLAGCGSSDVVSYEGEYSSTNDEGVETVTTVTYDQEGDDITNVQIDSTKGGVDKRTDEYGLEGDAGTWAEQADKVQTYIEENDEFPTLNAEGDDADSVTGATIGLSDIEEAFNSATEVE